MSRSSLHVGSGTNRGSFGLTCIADTPSAKMQGECFCTENISAHLLSSYWLRSGDQKSTFSPHVSEAVRQHHDSDGRLCSLSTAGTPSKYSILWLLNNESVYPPWGKVAWIKLVQKTYERPIMVLIGFYFNISPFRLI